MPSEKDNIADAKNDINHVEENAFVHGASNTEEKVETVRSSKPLHSTTLRLKRNVTFSRLTLLFLDMYLVPTCSLTVSHPSFTNTSLVLEVVMIVILSVCAKANDKVQWIEATSEMRIPQVCRRTLVSATINTNGV